MGKEWAFGVGGGKVLVRQDLHRNFAVCRHASGFQAVIGCVVVHVPGELPWWGARAPVIIGSWGYGHGREPVVEVGPAPLRLGPWRRGL